MSLFERYDLPGPSASRAMEPPEAGPSRLGTRAPRKKKQPRGRTMIVKVFYSLATPRPLTPALHSATLPSQSLASDGPREQSYTCLARLSAPVFVQLLGQAPDDAPDDAPSCTEYGRVTLKTCLSAICISRPELVDDPTKDYAVSAVDPYESSLLANPSRPLGTGQGLMEGKGMLSWNLAEKRQGTTWVCGKVDGGGRDTEARRRKKRRLDESAAVAGVLMDDSEDEDDDEDEVPLETLEVWLQLVERPSFTQDQFLTSLRSFANPVQLPADSSDRASSPPLRQHNRMRSSLGDPVKKKRPRELDAVPRGLMLPRSQSSPHLAVTPFDLPDASQTGGQMNLSTIQNPAMLALLSKLVPSLAGSGPVASGSTAPAFGLDSAQGRALIPLIRMLAQTHGIEMPSPDTPTLTPTPVDMSMIDPALSTALDKGKERQIEADIDLTAPNPYHNLTTGTAPPAPPPVEVQPVVSAPLPKKRAYGGKKKKVNVFAPIVQDVEELLDENGAPIKADTSHPLGCSNCFRKRSSVWRQSEEGTVVCNVCGIYFNKNGVHRTKPDRGTSPAPRTEPAPIEVDAPPATRANARVLQHRLTATCESDLLAQQKTKRRRTSGPGMVAPPSPSKTIGPMPRRIYSPGTATDFSSIFRQNSLGNPTQTVSHRNGAGGAHVMTSPGRSPRRSARTLGAGFGLAATSPVRGSTSNAGAPFTYGDGGGIEDAVESYDFSALYAGHQSPSPARRNLGNGRAIPSYLLTESPGTALKRALNDTNIEIDMHSFDFPMTDEDFLQPGETGGAEELNFYLRSSPDEKENAPPHLIPFPPSTSTLSAPPPSSALLKDQPSTYFDSILSSLRRNFKSQLTSSTALPSTAHTTPSSPIPSSPCVQPRTSSATPGQKSKGPASCGRPAPTIEEGFIGRLIPALALGSTGGDDASWGELSGMQSTGDEYDLSNLLPTAGVPTISAVDSLTAPYNHQHHLLGSDGTDFDFGSLPPSSPPLLPSESFPTPSEFGSGITPEEEPYREGEDDGTEIYRVPSELPRTIGGAHTKEDVAALLHSLGLPAHEGNAWGGAAAGGGALDSSTMATLLQLIQSNAGAADSPALSTSTSNEMEEQVLGLLGKTRNGGDYDSLF